MSALCALVAIALPIAAREEPPIPMAEWERYAVQFAYNRESAAQFGPRLISMQAYWQAMWNQGTDEALDCSRVVRVGDPSTDGGKLLCDDAMPKPGEPCRVVSVSTSTDFRFEADLHRRYPHCKIESYGQAPRSVDPSLGGGKPAPTPEPPDFVTHAPISMGRDSWKLFAAGERVNLFRIHCEGCEEEALRDPFIRQLCPDQFVLELGAKQHTQSVEHGSGLDATLRSVRNFYRFDQLLRSFNRTHGVFYKHPRLTVNDTAIVDLSWRRRGSAADCAAAAAAEHAVIPPGAGYWRERERAATRALVEGR